MIQEHKMTWLVYMLEVFRRSGRVVLGYLGDICYMCSGVQDVSCYRRFRRSNWGVEFRCQEFCVEDCLTDQSYDRVVLKIGGKVM